MYFALFIKKNRKTLSLLLHRRQWFNYKATFMKVAVLRKGYRVNLIEVGVKFSSDHH